MSDYYYQRLAQQGWQCPMCKKILAPFVQECTCQMQNTITTVSTTYKLREESGEIDEDKYKI